MADLLALLKAQKTADDKPTEEVELTVTSIANAQPTGNGLQRVIIKFKEIAKPQWILKAQLNGVVIAGSKVTCIIVQNGEYINFRSVQGRNYNEKEAFVATERLVVQL